MNQNSVRFVFRKCKQKKMRNHRDLLEFEFTDTDRRSLAQLMLKTSLVHSITYAQAVECICQGACYKIKHSCLSHSQSLQIFADSRPLGIHFALVSFDLLFFFVTSLMKLLHWLLFRSLSGFFMFQGRKNLLVTYFLALFVLPYIYFAQQFLRVFSSMLTSKSFRQWLA